MTLISVLFGDPYENIAALQIVTRRSGAHIGPYKPPI